MVTNVDTLVALGNGLSQAIVTAQTEIDSLPEHLDPSDEFRAIMIASARANAIAEAILEFTDRCDRAAEIKARAVRWLDG